MPAQPPWLPGRGHPPPHRPSPGEGPTRAVRSGGVEPPGVRPWRGSVQRRACRPYGRRQGRAGGRLSSAQGARPTSARRVPPRPRRPDRRGPVLHGALPAAHAPGWPARPWSATQRCAPPTGGQPSGQVRSRRRRVPGLRGERGVGATHRAAARRRLRPPSLRPDGRRGPRGPGCPPGPVRPVRPPPTPQGPGSRTSGRWPQHRAGRVRRVRRAVRRRPGRPPRRRPRRGEAGPGLRRDRSPGWPAQARPRNDRTSSARFTCSHGKPSRPKCP